MRTKSILVLVMVLIGISNATPVEWSVSSGGNGHFYEVISEALTWTDARDAAISAGGYLATITSEAEDIFVWNLLDSSHFGGHYGPWLGGFQPDGSPEPDG